MTQQPWGQPAPQQAPWGQPAQQPAYQPPAQQGYAPPAQQQPWGQQPQQQHRPPMQQQTPAQSDVDPFSMGEKTPSISFKDAPVGAHYKIQLTDKAKRLQQHNFETGELDFWPLSDADRAMGKQIGDPKMAAVLNGIVLEGRPDDIGQKRSVWASLQTKQGSLCAAISKAQTEAGEQMAPGGVLTITLVGLEPNENPRLSPRKLYAASYQRPGPGAPGDAFAGGTPQDAPVQQAYQPAPQDAPPPEWAQPPQHGYTNTPGVSGTPVVSQPPQDAQQPPWGQQAAQPGTVQHFQQVGAQGTPQDAPPPAPAAAPPSSPWG